MRGGLVDYRLLGPFEVARNGHLVDVGGPRQRALLAILLLRANQPVHRDVLVDELWGEQPPPGAGHAVAVYISRLRKTLESAAGSPCVLTRPGAYILQVADEQVDVARFERLAEDGRRSLAAGAPERAAAQLGGALALWRGRPLSDFRDEPFAQAEIGRLERLRAEVVEDRVEADLAVGRHADVVGELEVLVAAHPLRERLHGQLMVALYRCGRQAEALAAYQAARRTLVEELGIEPGPALQRLEGAILQQDASLDLPAPAAAAPALGPAAEPGRPAPVRPGRKKRLIAVAGALAVAISLLVAVTTRGHAHLVAGANTVAMIDTGQSDLSSVVTGVGRPNGVASSVGAVWITDSADDQLLRVNPARQVDDRIPVGHGPAGVTVGDGQVWVANQLDGTVSEVNPGAGRQVAVIPVGIGPSAVAFGFGSVWVANATGDTLTRIDAATGKVVKTIGLSSSPAGVAVGFGSVWVADQESGLLLRVDPAGDRVVQPISVGQSPDGVTVGASAVWVADADGTVVRYDPRTDNQRTISVGGAPAGVAYAGGAVWVANSLTGAVDRIDPTTGAVQAVHLGNEPAGLAAAGNRVWATVLPSLASHRGGTLAIIDPQPAALGFPADPAVAWWVWAWQMLSMTNDGLVGYRRVGGLAGGQLVPDLATTLPVPTDGGKTYVFQLRSGIRYSNGQPVKPQDFRRALERVFTINRSPTTGGNPQILTYAYDGIVGARRCEHGPGPCDLARGIGTSDAANTVTFHLTAPDPQFLYKLAFPWAYPVPPGTPDHLISPAQLPATGPYMTKSYVSGHTWVLVRNLRFHQWSQQAQPGGYPDRIVVRYGVAPGRAVADVEHGRADALLDPPPGSVGQLATRYTSQLHSGPAVATTGLALNTRIPPFDSLDARRALNYAINKTTVIDLSGGPLTAQPTCQILPPTMPGYQPYCPYTLHPSPGGAWSAPDLARAQQLVRASGTRGDKVTVPGGTWSGAASSGAATARYIASVLDQLGYRASVRLFADAGTQLGWGWNSRNRPQISVYGWIEDYPAPYDFIGPLFTCASFVPDTWRNSNAAEFCDPRIDTQVRQALTVQARGLAAAEPSWAAIDRELVNQAPWVPLYTWRDLTVLATRTGNYQFHPQWNLLIDQLWVR